MKILLLSSVRTVLMAAAVAGICLQTACTTTDSKGCWSRKTACCKKVCSECKRDVTDTCKSCCEEE